MVDTEPVTSGPRLPGWLTRRAHAPLAPTVGALLMGWASLTPSLLPLGPVLQALVSAVSAALGYAAGSLAGWTGSRSPGDAT